MVFKGHARRYAQAIFEIALERKELDKWESDLESIAQLGKDASVIAVMENPKLSYAAKIKILSEPLAGIGKMAVNLVYLLISRRRFNLITEIAEQFVRLYDNYRGLVKAEVFAAAPLSKDDETKLSERLGDLFLKKVLLKSRVERNLAP